MKDLLSIVKELLCELSGKLDQNKMIEQIKYIKQDIFYAYQPTFDDSAWQDPTNGITFDKNDDIIWIRVRIRIPERICQIPVSGSKVRVMSVFQAPVVLYIDGKHVLEEKNWVDFRCPEVVISDSAVPEAVHTLAFRIDAAHADLFYNRFFIEVFANAIDDIRFDINSLLAEFTYAQTLPDVSNVLESAANWLIPKLQAILSGEISGNDIPDILAQVRNRCEPIRKEAKRRQIHLVGHAHIDMNWLWEMEETKDLIFRDFTTVCNISDDYPSFRFSQSQCAAYQIAQNNFPDLFERVKQKIKEEKWDVTASAWVEHDANMVSGESMARHLLYSQSYLKEQFEIKPRIMWAPDTFGHSGNIPQLLKKSGIGRYFMMRCGKEDHNSAEERWGYGREVSDSPVFFWKGIDGSCVLAANLEYNGEFIPAAITRNMIQAQKQGMSVALYVYGVGDHGGAPTRRDVARAISAGASPLFPEILLSTTEAYYNAAQASAPQDLRVCEGELNFVFEGCYTTHADIKQRNRQLEYKLVQAETICLMARQKGFVYPFEELRDCWLCLLFNQFHDIFDGCAIAETYQLAVSDMDSALKRVEDIILRASDVLTKPWTQAVTVVNSSAYPLKTVIFLPNARNDCMVDAHKNPVVTQVGSDGLYFAADVHGLSMQEFSLSTKKNSSAETAILTETPDAYQIDTDFYYVVIKKSSGQFVTYYDKISKRFLARQGAVCWRSDRGMLNTFSITQEAPVPMSSWMIGETENVLYIKDHAISHIKENGALLAVLSFKHLVKDSVIRQNIIFSAVNPVIQFQTEVEWNEAGNSCVGTPVLRVGFAPEIDNCTVLSEIPFGVIKRSCKQGEYPQLRFSAIEDDKGGFSVLNDCKYGINTCGNQMDLTLIRSGWDPDLRADIGHHHFTYAIYCFAGSLKQSDILTHAQHLQTSPLVLIDKAPVDIPGIQWDLPSQIAVSCIKFSEDQTGIIIRLYECFGDETTMVLPVPEGMEHAAEVESGEDSVLTQYTIKQNQLCLHFKPFEIKTIKLY